jgi:tetratricopeptide (TPR) repeat protein
MNKKEKKRKKGKEQQQQKTIKNPRLETLSKIVELIDIANDYYMKMDYDNAIDYSEKIIRLAITSNFEHHIKEQQQFLTKIAKRVQEKYFVSEIKEAIKEIEKIYNILLEAKQVSQAHEILETFKRHYQDKIDLDSIPLIKELEMKDRREWIKNKVE